MDYIVTKQTPRNEWRIYLDENTTDDTIIYKGHKLGIEKNHLLEFLEYRQEKSTGRIFFLNYENANGTPNAKDHSMWIPGNSNTLEKTLEQSWDSLQKKLKEQKKDFRKITITRVNV
jgi:tRNA U34 5-carboxymethylaminomethyl modifying enzyme MnmG/GidA